MTSENQPNLEDVLGTCEVLDKCFAMLRRKVLDGKISLEEVKHFTDNGILIPEAIVPVSRTEGKLPRSWLHKVECDFVIPALPAMTLTDCMKVKAIVGEKDLDSLETHFYSATEIAPVSCFSLSGMSRTNKAAAAMCLGMDTLTRPELITDALYNAKKVWGIHQIDHFLIHGGINFLAQGTNLFFYLAHGKYPYINAFNFCFDKKSNEFDFLSIARVGSQKGRLNPGGRMFFLN